MPNTPLIDAHCHLDFSNFDDDRDEVLKQAEQNGISDIIIPGISTNNWPKIKKLCAHNKNLHPCYGLHPYWTDQHKKSDLEKLRQYLDNNPCVAIGECGLDYRPDQADKNKQQYFFETQLDIALEKNLPAVIHSVRATEDVIRQIQKRPGLKGMVHSYSGSYEQALQLIEMGFYISLSAAITYQRANKIRTTVSKLPLTSLLIETDAPDQIDASRQGKRNQPGYLREVFNALSELRDDTQENIALQLQINTKSLFRLV